MGPRKKLEDYAASIKITESEIIHRALLALQKSDKNILKKTFRKISKND